MNFRYIMSVLPHKFLMNISYLKTSTSEDPYKPNQYHDILTENNALCKVSFFGEDLASSLISVSLAIIAYERYNTVSGLDKRLGSVYRRDESSFILYVVLLSAILSSVPTLFFISSEAVPKPNDGFNFAYENISTIKSCGTYG